MTQPVRVCIRVATDEDQQAIEAVRVAAWRVAFRGIVPQAHLDALDAPRPPRQRRPESLWLVAEREGTVVGFAIGGADRTGDERFDAEVYAIYVHPAVQCTGVGRALMSRAAEGLAARGMRSLRVWTLAASPYRAFYERLGGVPAGEKVFEIGGASLAGVSYGWPDITDLVGKQ